MPQHHRVVARVGGDITFNENNRVCAEGEEFEVDEVITGGRGNWGKTCKEAIDRLWDRTSSLFIVNGGGSTRANDVFSPFGLVMRLATDLLARQADARHSTITVSILSHGSDHYSFADLLLKHPPITSKVKLRTSNSGYTRIIGASEKLLESTDSFLDILKTALNARKTDKESLLVRFNFVLYYGMQRLDAHLDVFDPVGGEQLTTLTPFQNPKSYRDSDLNELLSHYFLSDEDCGDDDDDNDVQNGTSDPGCGIPIIFLLLDAGVPNCFEALKKFAEPVFVSEKESILSLVINGSPTGSPRREVFLPESATTPQGSIANESEHKYSIVLGRLDATEKLVLKLEQELSTKAAQHRHMKQTNLQLKQDLEDHHIQSKLLTASMQFAKETEATLRLNIRDRDKVIRRLEIESFAASQEMLEMKSLFEAEKKKSEQLKQQLAPPSVTADSCGYELLFSFSFKS